MYELLAALIAARGGDQATLWQRWQRAYDIGQHVGADRGEPLQFGPSNVAIWSVSLPVEMLDGATAVAASYARRGRAKCRCACVYRGD